MRYEQLVSSISDRWTDLMTELERECGELGRDLPTVIAVTKTRTMEEVQAAIDVGMTNFGENYPDEFDRKASQFPDQDWHYIGHLQRNDANLVVPHAKIIHTLDRKKLTRRLLYFNYDGNTFVQVNMSQEGTKSGTVYSFDVVEDLVSYSRDEGLTVAGLMGMGSLDWTSQETAEEFEKFADFGQSLGLDNLSLGMSDDWQLAIRAGSTHLRLGTAIFGPRQ